MQAKIKILNFLRDKDPIENMALEMKLNYIPTKSLEKISDAIDKDDANPRDIKKLLNQSFL